MHGEPTNVVGEDFNFTGVDADADIYAGISGNVRNREPAQHRGSSALERGQETIASGFDLASTEAVQLSTHNSVMFCEKQLPSRVSEP